MTQTTATKIPYTDADLQHGYKHIDLAFQLTGLDPTKPDDVSKALQLLVATRPDDVTDEDADKFYTYAQRHLPKAIYTVPVGADAPAAEVKLTDPDAFLAEITAKLAVMMGLDVASFPSYDVLEDSDAWPESIEQKSPEYKEAYRLEILRQFNLQGGK